MPPPRKKAVKTIELGGSGTTIYDGVIVDVEYNPTLSTEYGGTGLKIYERMRKSDSIVKGSLNIVKLGILQAEWNVEVDSEESQDVEIRDFIEEALFERMNQSWSDSLREVLTYLDFGFSVVEKVFKIEDDKIWIKKLAFRAQTSITKFETADKQEGVTQQLQGQIAKDKDTQPSIPLEKLLVFSNEKEGDNWRGVSILRPAYKPWFFKENFEKIEAIGFERESVGIPVFKMPDNPNEEDSQKADELGENLRANEKAYLKLPAGWDFEIVYPTGSNRRNADEAIRRLNRDIFSNVLAQFLDLGSGSTGSRALSTDQSSAFYKSLKAIGDYVTSVINDHLIRQLVDLNFDNVKMYPKLTVSNLQKIDFELFSSAMQRLSMAGVIQPDEDLEDYVRQAFGLPPKMDVSYKDEAVDENGDIMNGKPVKTDKGDMKEEKKKQDKEKQKQLDKVARERGKKKVKKFNVFQPWRPFTFAEDKVNFRTIHRQMEEIEVEMKTELQRLLGPDVASILDDARVAIQLKDANRVQDLQVRFREEVRQYLIDKYTQAFEVGKLTASNEVDVPAPRTRKQMIDLISTQADITSRKITDDLLNKAKLTVVSQIQQETPTDEAARSLNQILDDQLLQSIALTSSAVTVGGINMGRDSVFDEHPEKIYALQRSEILDTRVCPYCISMDGRVVQKGDEITKHSQFHFLCRGIWVSILVDEEEKPDITGIPQQLRERVGTLEEFKQIKNPMPLKDSLAEKFTKGQL